MNTSTKPLPKESTSQCKNTSSVNSSQLSERVRKSNQSDLDLKSQSSVTSSLSGNVTPTYGKLKTYPIRRQLSTTPKPSVSKQRNVMISQSSKNRSTSSNQVQESPKPFATQEDIDQFSSKFHELTETILNLATSKDPLHPLSLEILLSKEIENSLGPAVNNPKYSQRFIQATRTLLESLVCMYEEGKLNNQLLNSQKRAHPPFLRARSSTTVCYRDQYLKELIMNMLHNMCSNQVEEEVTKASSHLHNLSESSRHRIHAIRDIVRAEAGIEPEAFHQLEKQLEELQRALSKNKLEALKAANEDEKTISEHLLTNLSSLHSLQIPNSARDALKRGKIESKSDCDDNMTECLMSKNCLGNNSLLSSKSSIENIETSTNAAKNFMHFIKGLHDNKVRDLDLSHHVKCSMEATDNVCINPDIQKIIDDELSKAYENFKILLNCEEKCNNPILLRSPFKSSFESSHFETSDGCYNIDEINSGENAIFLNALKADLQEKENKIVLNDLKRSIGLDMTGENDDVLVSVKDMNLDNSVLKLSKDQNLNKVKNENTYFQFGKLTLNHMVLEPDMYSVPTTLIINAPNTTCYVTLLIEINNEETLYETNQIANTIPLTKWWSQDEFLAKQIVKELKQAFENENISNTSVEFDIKNHHRKIYDEELNKYFHVDLDFTVEEILYILKEVSLKIIEFPSLLQNTESGKKEEIMKILSTIENYLNYSDESFNSVDVTDPLTKQYLFLLSVLNVSNVLSFLSERLQLLPYYLKNKSILILSPPKTLINTISFLASSDHFKNCFDSVRKIRSQKNAISTGYSNRQPNNVFSGKEIDQIALNSCKQVSSETINPWLESTTGDQFNVNVRKAISRNLHKYDEFQTGFSKLEQHLGLGLTMVTVQHISEIFLYFSTVLNDVPDRIKTQKLLNMNPPETLIKILDVLYTEESVIRTDSDKRESFASLTIQNASDVFLALSKALQDAPPRIKRTPILKLDPPPSLRNAITILTYPSESSVLENMKQKDVDQNTLVEDDSQECFFDALESLTDD